jgi:hypothetical protein
LFPAWRSTELPDGTRAEPSTDRTFHGPPSGPAPARRGAGRSHACLLPSTRAAARQDGACRRRSGISSSPGRDSGAPGGAGRDSRARRCPRNRCMTAQAGAALASAAAAVGAAVLLFSAGSDTSRRRERLPCSAGLHAPGAPTTLLREARMDCSTRWGANSRRRASTRSCAISAPPSGRKWRHDHRHARPRQRVARERRLQVCLPRQHHRRGHSGAVRAPHPGPPPPTGPCGAAPGGPGGGSRFRLKAGAQARVTTHNRKGRRSRVVADNEVAAALLRARE